MQDLGNKQEQNGNQQKILQMQLADTHAIAIAEYLAIQQKILPKLFCETQLVKSSMNYLYTV
jgi:hypothetical protein